MLENSKCIPNFSLTHKYDRILQVHQWIDMSNGPDWVWQGSVNAGPTELEGQAGPSRAWEEMRSVRLRPVARAY